MCPCRNSVIDALLFSAVQLLTFRGGQPLTNASGFFFQCENRLFLVTSRHVIWDPDTGHHPDSVRIALHSDRKNVARLIDFEIPLYQRGQSVWRQGNDSAGDIDVAVIALDRTALPPDLAYHPFTLHHLADEGEVPLGTPLLIVGFPLGFQDQLHRLPIARHAILSSCFDLRFQGEATFLTDARTHRGMSGAPVVMRMSSPSAVGRKLPWKLLGIHSARLDVRGRDTAVDDRLGLNSAWFADILLTLTDAA